MIMHLNIHPKLLHNHCFQFLLGITVVPREIKDNTYAKFKVYKKIVNLKSSLKVLTHREYHVIYNGLFQT